MYRVKRKCHGRKAPRRSVITGVDLVPGADPDLRLEERSTGIVPDLRGKARKRSTIAQEVAPGARIDAVPVRRRRRGPRIESETNMTKGRVDAHAGGKHCKSRPLTCLLIGCGSYAAKWPPKDGHFVMTSHCPGPRRLAPQLCLLCNPL